MSLLRLYYRKTLLFSFFTLFSFSLSGKNYKRLDLASGLPGNTIKCIYKDSKGLMWIATETGLCTYNGKSVQIIDEQDGLIHNVIWKITEDGQNNIWLSVYGHGVAKFDGKKFTFYDKSHGLVHNSVRTLFYSKKHHCMVFGTEDGISLFDGKRFKNIKKRSKSITGKFQINYAADYANQIIVASGFDYIYALDIPGNDIQKVKLHQVSKVKNQNYAALIDGERLYNMSVYNELLVENLKSKQLTTLGKKTVVWDFVKGSHQQIYMACWDGNGPEGGVFTIKGKSVEDLSEQYKLPTRQFWCLYYDKQSSKLWAGTVNDGVYIIDLAPISKLVPLHLPLGISPKVNALCRVGQTLYLGGDGYLASKARAREKVLTSNILISNIKQFLKNKSIPLELKKTLRRDKHFVCHSIKNDSKGMIWAMTNFGLIQFDTNFKIHSIDFVLSTGGFFEFTPENNILIIQNYWFPYLKQGEHLEPIFVNGKQFKLNASAVLKSGETTWITSYSKRLFVYENKRLFAIDSTHFGNENNLTSIASLGKNRIAVGTVNGKIFICTWNKGKFNVLKRLLPENHLIGNTIFFIKPFKEFLIIGTNKGINILKNGKPFHFFNSEENILLVNYLSPEFDFQNKNLLVPTNNGCLQINLEKLLERKQVNSDLFFSSFKVNNQSLKLSGQLNLGFHQNNIEVSFLSNNLYNPKKNRYRYKIIGDKKSGWSAYSSESTIKFFGLSPGKYDLIIEGKNIGTGEHFNSIQLPILILPPFYDRGWFIILVINVLILIIGLIYKLNIKRIKSQSEMKIRVAENKLFSLQSQMKPHFLFNAINSIQNIVIDNNTEKALTYIGKFSKLIRQTLHFSDQNRVCLKDEISYLRSYMDIEKLRFGKDITYHFNIDEHVNILDTFIKPMLIQPIIENVFVHAFDSKTVDPQIQISFSIIDNYIICTVIDNGRGVSPSFDPLHQSKGLKLVIERIQLIDSSLVDPVHFTQNIPNGTLVSIQIPIVR
jgi:ligand-binding sensor domain-containing protein